MTAAVPYVLFQVAALLGAAGQALYKAAVDQKQQADRGGKRHLVPMLAGVAVYCGALGLFVVAFRAGGQLSSLYATYSTTFVWSLVIARLFFGESITLQKVVGVLLIVGGVSLVTLF